MKLLPVFGLLALPTVAAAQLPAICEVNALPVAPLDEGDRYGTAVDVGGGVAVVSAPWDDDAASGAGAVFVFERSGDDWVEVAKLVASDAGTNDGFGASVATDGLLIVVGCRGHLHAGSAEPGAVYIFEKVGGLWTQIDEIYGGERPVSGPNAWLGDDFGVSVAVHSDRVAVGAPGFGSVFTPDGPPARPGEPGFLAEPGTSPPTGGGSERALNLGRVYVFERDAEGWDVNRRISISDPCCGEYFGYRIAMARRRIAVLDPSSPKRADVTLVYYNPNPGVSFWGHERTITSPVNALAFNGNTLVTTDYFRTLGGKFGAGRAQVYTRTGTSWSRTQILTAPTPAANELFGVTAALDGQTLLVGASDDDQNPLVDAGVVHAYQKDAAGTWVHRGYVSAPDGAAYDGFGSAIGLEGTQAVVGAPRRSAPGQPPVQNVGGAYALELAAVLASQELALPGVPANPTALLPGATAGPVVGALWDPAVDHTSFYPSATLDWLVVSTQAPVNTVIGAGTLVCPLTGAKLRTTSAGTPFQLPVPADCSLIGRTGCAQGASSGPSGLQLTNGFSLVLGSQ